MSFLTGGFMELPAAACEEEPHSLLETELDRARAASREVGAHLIAGGAGTPSQTHELLRRLYTAEERVTQARLAAAERTRWEFLRLAEAWRTECGTSSNMVKIHLQPSYQRIIGLGPEVLPFIFAEMKCRPDFWFWALRAITGENPVPAEHAGDLQRMTQDWLDWAEKKGYAFAASYCR
jgi:hypothetical protein